jgi:hypothetical protein
MQAARNKPKGRISRRRLLLMFPATVGVMFGGIAGCGKFYWFKPGATTEDFYRGSQECAQKSSGAGVTEVGIGLDETAYRNCLRTRGYTREQHSSQPPEWHRGIE